MLYTRAGCHLCDEMRAGLAGLRQRLGFTLVEQDVGWDGELAERYGRSVPVLVLDGREVCRHILDAASLTAALAAQRRSGERSL